MCRTSLACMTARYVTATTNSGTLSCVPKWRLLRLVSIHGPVLCPTHSLMCTVVHHTSHTNITVSTPRNAAGMFHSDTYPCNHLWSISWTVTRLSSGLSQMMGVAETCVTIWSASSTKPGRKAGCRYPQEQAPPSPGYAPLGSKGSSLLCMTVTSRPIEATSASMLSHSLRYESCTALLSVRVCVRSTCCTSARQLPGIALISVKQH